MKLRQAICKELKIIRKNERLTCRGLSAKMNLHDRSYGKVERCESGLTIDKLEEIATLMGYTIEFKLKKK